MDHSIKNAGSVIAMTLEIINDLKNQGKLGKDKELINKFLAIVSAIGLASIDMDFLEDLHETIHPMCMEKLKEITEEEKEGKEWIKDNNLPGVSINFIDPNLN